MYIYIHIYIYKSRVTPLTLTGRKTGRLSFERGGPTGLNVLYICVGLPLAAPIDLLFAS